MVISTPQDLIGRLLIRDFRTLCWHFMTGMRWAKDVSQDRKAYRLENLKIFDVAVNRTGKIGILSPKSRDWSPGHWKAGPAVIRFYTVWDRLRM